MNRERILFLITASLLMTACFRSVDKSEKRDELPSETDASANNSEDSGSATNARNNTEVDDNTSYDSGSADSQIPKDTPEESGRRDDNPVEGIEVCLESMKASWARVTWVATTDSEGNYSIDSSEYISPSSYALTPRKTGYAFEPDRVVLDNIGTVVAGNVEDDFAIVKIDTGPHATGQWKLVEFNPSTETPCRTLPLIVVPAGIYDNFQANCSKELNTIYTFEDGCLLGELSINCVDNTQYSAGSGRCHTDPVYSWSEYNGYFDEDTNRWHLTESAMIVVPGQGVGGLGGYVTQVYSAELVLERVSSAMSTP